MKDGPFVESLPVSFNGAHVHAIPGAKVDGNQLLSYTQVGEASACWSINIDMAVDWDVEVPTQACYQGWASEADTPDLLPAADVLRVKALTSPLDNTL